MDPDTALQEADAAYNDFRFNESIHLARDAARTGEGLVKANATSLLAHSLFEIGSLYSAANHLAEARLLFTALDKSSSHLDHMADGIAALARDPSRRLQHEFAFRFWLIHQLLESRVAAMLRPGSTIVDLGCGRFDRSAKDLTESFPQCRVIGVDIDASCGEDTRWKSATNGGRFISLDISRDPCPDLEAVAVYSNGLFTFIPALDTAVESAADMLALGGWLIGGYDRKPVDYHFSGVSLTSITSRERHALDGLNNSLHRSGFTDIYLNSIEFWTEFASVDDAMQYVAARSSDANQVAAVAHHAIGAGGLAGNWTLFAARLPG